MLDDDADHVNAALLLHDILRAQGGGGAGYYLGKAKTALKRLEAQIEQRSQSETWLPLSVGWSYGAPPPERPTVISVPADFWVYGAKSDVLPLDRPTTIRIRAQVLNNRVGFCLMDAQTEEPISEQCMLSQEMGEELILLVYAGRPARLGVRNWGDKDHASEVDVRAIEYVTFV
jgi:hypothetical protein